MNTPKTKFRAGAISATVWENTKTIEGVEQKVLSVTIEKSYKDKDGNWKTTSSFQVNDVPKVALVANKAFEYIVLAESDREENSSPSVLEGEAYPKIKTVAEVKVADKIRELVEIGVPPEVAARIAMSELEK